MDSPSIVAKKLFQFLSNRDVKNLIQFRRSFTSQPIAVTNFFFQNSGCEKLFSILTHYRNSSLNPTLDARPFLVEALRAVKAVMRTPCGLEHMAKSSRTPSTFASVLTLRHEDLLKHIYGIISALLVCSDDGYLCAMNAFAFYQAEQCLESKFEHVVEDLKAESLSLQAAALTLVNCVVASTDSIWDRVQIQNELQVLGLDRICEKFRFEGFPTNHSKDATKSDVSSQEAATSELLMQLAVFEDHAKQDAQLVLETFGFDVSDFQYLLHNLLKYLETQDSTGLCRMKLLHVLQNMFQLQTRDRRNPGRKRETNVTHSLLADLETTTKRSTVIGEDVDDTSLSNYFYTTSIQRPSSAHFESSRMNPIAAPSEKDTLSSPHCSCNCHSLSTDELSQNMSQSDPNLLISHSNINENLNKSASNVTFGNATTESSNTCIAKPPPIPELKQEFSHDQRHSREVPEDDFRLPPVPKPSSKLRSVNWQKLPKSVIFSSENNMWRNVLREISQKQEDTIDFSTIEGYFKQKVDVVKVDGDDDSVDGSQSSSRGDGIVRLLDEKRALSINVLIKQFRCSHSEILGKIRRGDSASIGMERLRALQKLLPTASELEKLRNYSGDKTKLDEAEKFLKLLISLPHYDLRIECMLAKETYEEKAGSIRKAIDCIQSASKEIVDNKLLCELLAVILQVGNFLNEGGYAGNALGVKLESLCHILDSSTNHYRRKLRHIVAQEAVKKNPEIESIRSSMPTLQKASRESRGQIEDEVSQLSTTIDAVLASIVSSTSYVRDQFRGDLEAMRSSCSNWSTELENLRLTEKAVLSYFCEIQEGQATYTCKLEDALCNIDSIVEKFEKSLKENEEIDAHEELKAQREMKKSKSFTASFNLLDEVQSSSSSESNNTRPFSTLDFQKTLLKTKSTLKPNRRRAQLKHSSTFSTIAAAHHDFSSEDVSNEDLPQSTTKDLYKVLLRETPHRPHAYRQQSSSSTLNEIRKARKEQMLRARERRKREIQILSDTALKQLSQHNEDVTFLGFTNHNIDTDYDKPLDTSKSANQEQPEESETTVLSTSEDPLMLRQQKHETHRSSEVQKSRLAASKMCVSAPESSNGRPNKSSQSNYSKFHKSQHSVEKLKSQPDLATSLSSTSTSTPEKSSEGEKDRSVHHSEHNPKEDTSCTSSDGQSDEDSSDLSSDEATVIENCQSQLRTICESPNS